MSIANNQSGKSNFWLLLVAGVVLVIGCALGAKAFTRMGEQETVQAPTTIEMPAVPEKSVAPVAPPTPPDPKELFYAWARQEYGVKSIRAEMSSVFVEFQDDKYTTTPKEQLIEIAKLIAARWGKDNEAIYVNCRVMQGEKEFASGNWMK